MKFAKPRLTSNGFPRRWRLCQMLLLSDRKEEYAVCVADQLLPLAGRVLAAPAENPGGAASVVWTILPLAVGEFTAASSRNCPDGSVRP